ncbi:MAG: ABC transporter ATP-binding protein [Lachnospiraceae bacterium]|nr:ABC transporter ATP-binding protein [Lachnospiraceae bacterium]
MKEVLLRTEKLSKTFSNGGQLQHVLKNVDLELYKGDFTVIMGASGAGKSTLLYALSGAAGLLTSKDKKKIVEYAKELFRAVDISEETQNKFPTQISGGESQRAGIVRALVNSPRILFADEPTGALNSKTGLDVLNTLTEFNGRGQSIVMVTHDMRSARRGNRILYLKDGSVLGECNLGRYVHGDKERHEKLATFLTEMGW